MTNAVYAGVTVSLILLVAGGFAGPWLAVGDALAVVRPVAALLLAIWLLPRLQPYWAVLPGLVLAGFALISVAVPFVTVPAPGPVRLYQKNLSFRLTDPAPLLQDIRAAAPDVITLQEVTEVHRLAVMQALADLYPSQGFCPFAGVGGTAVLSRWPVAGAVQCPAAKGATILPLQTPHGRVTVVSLHLHWPFPHGQRAQLDRLLPDLVELGGSVVVGGDLNMVAWGWPVAALSRAARGGLAGPAVTSFRIAGWLPIGIDHVLAPGRGVVERRGTLGSDHYGLLARVWP